MEAWDDEDEDEAGEAEDGSVDTTPCPYCKRPIYEEAEVCPHCGAYVSDEDDGAVRHRKPWWIVIMALLVLAAIVLHWVVGRH